MAFGAWTKHINTDCTDSRGHFIEWSELHVATFLILRCLHRFKTSWEIRWFLLSSFPLMGSLLAKPLMLPAVCQTAGLASFHLAPLQTNFNWGPERLWLTDRRPNSTADVTSFFISRQILRQSALSKNPGRRRNRQQHFRGGVGLMHVFLAGVGWGCLVHSLW